jgi:hypothetical protein
MVTHPLAAQDLDGLVHAAGLSAGLGRRGHASSRPVLAEEWLDAGETHPEPVREGTR